MANLLFLVLSLVSPCAHAEDNFVRMAHLKSEYTPSQEIFKLSPVGTTGRQLLLQNQMFNIQRYLQGCLRIDCGLDADEKTTVQNIIALVGNKNIRVFFATDSADLFNKADAGTKQYLASYGFSEAKDLFALPEYVTHRVVVSPDKPGPIIFNQYYFSSTAKPFTAAELLSYVVHEMGHQTGLSFEHEAFLDRLGQKMATVASQKGGEAIHSSNPDWSIVASNMILPTEAFKFKIKELALYNVGELLVSDRQNFFNVGPAIAAATMRLDLSDLPYLTYLWVGKASFGGIQTVEPEQKVQVVRGPLTLIYLNGAGTKTTMLSAQYEVFIPIIENGAKVEIKPGLVTASVFGVRDYDEDVINPQNIFKVLDVKTTVAPQGISVSLKCDHVPTELTMVLKKDYSRLVRSTDANFQQFFVGELQANANGQCHYFFSADPDPGSSLPSLSAEVVQFLVSDKDQSYFIVPPTPFHFSFQGNASDDSHQFSLSDVTVAWAVAKPDGSWSAIERIDPKQPLDAKKLADPKYQISFEAQLNWGSALFCGGTMVLKGKPTGFAAGITYDTYIGDYFPQDSVPVLSDLFKLSSYQEVGGAGATATGASMIAILNKEWITSQLTNIQFAYASIYSCSSGPVYFNF